MSARRYRTQHVATTPAGWHVRTVRSGDHLVRVAFPPGRRHRGEGQTVEVLHPVQENPCRVKNPAELLLMGANPICAHNHPSYDALPVKEKLAFGRLGLGKAQLRSAADIHRARNLVKSVERQKNRFPNPGVDVAPGFSPASGDATLKGGATARDLYERFTEEESTRYTVTDEPHIPAGDYALLGDFIVLRVKPTASGSVEYIQEILFPAADIKVISDPKGRPIHFAGSGQDLSPADIRRFTSDAGERPELGVCESIVYLAPKWHQAVPPEQRGKEIEWEHKFGEDGGEKPRLYYRRDCRRLELKGGSYHVEGAGIVN
jgi:hypothetical protein